MKKIINLLGHGLFYTLAVSIESLAPFILAPLLTHYLSVFDYGLWAIFQSATAFLRPLLGMTFDDYIRMRYFKQSREETVGYLFSIMLVSALLAVLLTIITFIFNDAITSLLHFPASWLWSIMLCAWLHAMFYLLLAYHQFDENRKRFATIHFVQAAMTLLCSIALVMSDWGWRGAVIGKMIGLSCGVGIAFFWIVIRAPKSAEKYIKPGHVLELVSFGMRYLGNGMVGVVVVLTDRLMLANVIDVQSASLFSIASLFPMVLVIGIQGFIFAWQPWCFSKLARHDPADRPLLVMGALFYIIALPVGGLIMAWGACWLGPYVISTQFAGAFSFVYPLMMAMVAQGLYQFGQTVLQYYQKLNSLSAIAYLVMVLNAWFNWVLIPRMGTVGSAWATCFAFCIAFIITAVVAMLTLNKQCKSQLGS